MKRLIFVAVAALCIASQAEAGLLSSLLTFNGSQDNLTDQSVDSFIDVDNSGDLSLGDVLYGVATIDQITADVNDPGATAEDVAPGRIALAFAAQIDSFDTLAIPVINELRADVTFGAVTGAGPTLDDLLGGNGLISDNSIFAVFERPTGTNPIDFVNTSSGTGLLPLTDGSDPWDYVASGGIDLTTDDFFEAELTFELSSLEFDSGEQRGGFSVFDHTFAPGVQFLGVDVENIAGTAVTSHHLTVNDGSVISPADSPQIDNGWEFENNFAFSINAVPEPSSFLAFAGLAIAGLGVRRRRA